MRSSQKRMKKQVFHSESHALHQEIREIVTDLESINKEHKDIAKHKRVSASAVMLWIVIGLLLASLLMSSIGSYLQTGQNEGTGTEGGWEAQKDSEHTEKITITNESRTTRTEITQTPREPATTDEKYYGVMLQSLAPIQYEYSPGDDAVIEAVISIENKGMIETEASYALLDENGKELYRYSDGVMLGKDNGVLRKAILLTENYKLGRYDVEFKARFQVNATRYILSGRTGFNIVEREKEPIAARLGKAMPKLSAMHQILLLLALALNLLLVYHSWKLEKNGE